MKIATTRFGEIEADESRIIEMRGEILGFEKLKRFLLLAQDDKTPFGWFQSVDDGAIAFVVINPQVIKPDYEPEIKDVDVSLLEIEQAADVLLMSIVTIRSNPVSISVNLRAPIVINARKGLAKQIILDDPAQPVQFYVETGKAVKIPPPGDKGRDTGGEDRSAAAG